MKYGIYAIFDAAAGVFTAPTIDISDASAIRAFQQAVANSGSIMNFKPADFALHKIGTFNVETGCIEPMIPSSRISIGSDDYIHKEASDV